jgi:hypothetical protein
MRVKPARRAAVIVFRPVGFFILDLPIYQGFQVVPSYHRPDKRSMLFLA